MNVIKFDHVKILQMHRIFDSKTQGLQKKKIIKEK